MGFVILSRDITEEKVDVIVNSLGIVTSHYGAICRSIIGASKGDELKKLIDEKNGKVAIGDMFFTDSFGLPCKKILHLVTPFEKYDKEYTAFETALRDLLNLCRNCGYKSISIPILGTGANGYNPIEAQNILISMCAGFVDTYKDMNIRVVKKPLHLHELSEDLDDRDFEIKCHRDITAFETAMNHYYKNRKIKPAREERDYDITFFESAKPILPIGWVKEKAISNRVNIVIKPEEIKGKDIDEYITKYIEKRYVDMWKQQDFARKQINKYVGDGNSVQGSKYYYGLVCGGAKIPNRTKMFKIALALEMSENEARDFLSFFGIWPAATRPAEICIMSCIREGIYNMNSIDEMLREKKIATLFE